ncbi:hypothetical protein [Pseudonocardia sp. T1-2H]|uniref:hypothetical protein n=1 Tax=Pseudonocardia sp. T1-2H TaxID=3128899 RepID=UPI003100CF2B
MALAPREVLCPKRMHHGPCGGVRDDLACEIVPARCPFTARDAAVPWAGPDAPDRPEPPLLTLAAARPVVLTDLTVPPFDERGLTAVVRALAGSCDGLLVGEHQGRPDFPRP